MPRRIMVTGGSGFIGFHLVNTLLQRSEYIPVQAQRNPLQETGFVNKVEYRYLDMATTVGFDSKLMTGIDTVVHLAGIAHRQDAEKDLYRKINTEGSARLASQAVQAGVKRFIFLSTVKVHGDVTVPGEKFTEKSRFMPADDYARSKLDGEVDIKQACVGTDTGYIIMRVPMVYGPRVKANFLKLIRLVNSGLPLPLDGVSNLRSLLYVENLCEVVMKILNSDAITNREYLVADDAISTTKLVQKLSEALDKNSRLFHLPKIMQNTLKSFSHGRLLYNRLYESLCVDDRRIRAELDWSPAVKLETAMERTIKDYLQRQ